MSSVTLRSIGSFHVGGHGRRLAGLPMQHRRTVPGGAPRIVDPNGDYVVGQMYAQEYRLAAPRHALPVLLWHGGGMTGCHWESTPDGRTGWLWRFLEAGFDVFVTDAAERGRASWAPWPQIYAEAPLFRTKQEAWHMFRIGPQEGYDSEPGRRCPFVSQQFPVQAFDNFAQQWVPRWVDHEEMAQTAYDALIERVGPCIIVAHSQGGGYAIAAAQRHPRQVRAVVAIEPAGTCGNAAGAPQPHLAVWGDYLLKPEHPVWAGYRSAADSYWHDAFLAGQPYATLDLPAHGIHGNSHFPMLDQNSDQVFSEVLHWLEAQRLNW
ncbi:alpha/beta fold hydrolase [Variovorax paradoxus]|uniref:alpha/beta fold hydrolase n=1 Tax=Variovorax paradoxus TaxID=34073 RepID=UPI0029C829B1|nr:alpha/beta fold hydrolase [Variovorax paradoxus]